MSDKFDYSNLPYCRDCLIPLDKNAKKQCALYWRPQTNTKVFPQSEKWNCPKDSFGFGTRKR